MFSKILVYFTVKCLFLGLLDVYELDPTGSDTLLTAPGPQHQDLPPGEAPEHGDQQQHQGGPGEQGQGGAAHTGQSERQ